MLDIIWQIINIGAIVAIAFLVFTLFKKKRGKTN